MHRPRRPRSGSFTALRRSVGALGGGGRSTAGVGASLDKRRQQRRRESIEHVRAQQDGGENAGANVAPARGIVKQHAKSAGVGHRSGGGGGGGGGGKKRAMRRSIGKIAGAAMVGRYQQQQQQQQQQQKQQRTYGHSGGTDDIVTTPFAAGATQFPARSTRSEWIAHTVFNAGDSAVNDFAITFPACMPIAVVVAELAAHWRTPPAHIMRSQRVDADVHAYRMRIVELLDACVYYHAPLLAADGGAACKAMLRLIDDGMLGATLDSTLAQHVAALRAHTMAVYTGMGATAAAAAGPTAEPSSSNGVTVYKAPRSPTLHVDGAGTGTADVAAVGGGIGLVSAADMRRFLASVSCVRQVDVAALAEAVTQHMYGAFAVVQLGELLTTAMWRRGDGGGGGGGGGNAGGDTMIGSLAALVGAYTNVYDWVVRTILREPAVAERAAVLRYMVKLCGELDELHNYHALFAVVEALRSDAVRHLSHTFAALSANKRAALAFFDTLAAAGVDGTYAKYRAETTAFKSTTRRGEVYGTLPCVRLLVADLRHIGATYALQTGGGNDDVVIGAMMQSVGETMKFAALVHVHCESFAAKHTALTQRRLGVDGAWSALTVQYARAVMVAADGRAVDGQKALLFAKQLESAVGAPAVAVVEDASAPAPPGGDMLTADAGAGRVEEGGGGGGDGLVIYENVTATRADLDARCVDMVAELELRIRECPAAELPSLCQVLAQRCVDDTVLISSAAEDTPGVTFKSVLQASQAVSYVIEKVVHARSAAASTLVDDAFMAPVVQLLGHGLVGDRALHVAVVEAVDDLYRCGASTALVGELLRAFRIPVQHELRSRQRAQLSASIRLLSAAHEREPQTEADAVLAALCEAVRLNVLRREVSEAMIGERRATIARYRTVTAKLGGLIDSLLDADGAFGASLRHKLAAMQDDATARMNECSARVDDAQTRQAALVGERARLNAKREQLEARLRRINAKIGENVREERELRAVEDEAVEAAEATRDELVRSVEAYQQSVATYAVNRKRAHRLGETFAAGSVYYETVEHATGADERAMARAARSIESMRADARAAAAAHVEALLGQFEDALHGFERVAQLSASHANGERRMRASLQEARRRAADAYETLREEMAAVERHLARAHVDVALDGRLSSLFAAAYEHAARMGWIDDNVAA